jgi:hypothetical protein
MALCFLTIIYSLQKRMICGKFTLLLSPSVSSYGRVAQECASMEYGCALLQKAQEVEYPLVDAPKSVRNEESVTGAAGNSMTTHSHVVDAAAPSRKGVSEEGMFVTFQGPGVEIHDFF